MKSKKTPVFEHLFFKVKKYTEAGGLQDGLVTFGDISAAVSEINPSLEAAGKRPLSINNVANFWKDVVRTDPNQIWPESVLAKGYTGSDAIGLGAEACFQFVPLPPGQQVAFLPPLAPSEQALNHALELESLSMPTTTKALGRRDENWLAQVAVRLRIIESHFAIASPTSVQEITFLQTGIKLQRGEIDAAYSLVDSLEGRWLLAVEAKGRTDQIHVPQVVRASAGLLKQARERKQDVRGVIPMAIKVLPQTSAAHKRSRLHVVEFSADTGQGSAGNRVADSVLELLPPVTGIH